MQKLIVFFLFAIAAVHANWTIVKNAPPFSYTAEFGIQKGEIPIGKIVRTGLFTPSYYYDFFDVNDVLQVRGIARVFSLGFFFSWGMDIDFYEEGRLIGTIQGKIFTHSRAKFVFYNAKGVALANAHLNDESCNFLVVDSQNEETVLAELTNPLCK